VLKANVVRDQLSNRVNDMGRRVIGAGSEQAPARNYLGSRPAFDVDEADSQNVDRRTLADRCWRATAPVIAQGRVFESPIHRHNTPLVGPELTPEFCIESCFTYSIVRHRKTFREK
jgi:hypothetical protein